MSIKMIQNLHTHCTFCDGKNTPRELVERAIELGFDSLGFSSHANTIFGDRCEIGDGVDEYIGEICALKREYEGRIKVYLGAELDCFSAGVMPTERLDFSIASVHYAILNGEKICFDASPDALKETIVRHFGGDGQAYARLYYETMAKMPEKLHADFVGHFDLVSIYDWMQPPLFDTGAAEYRKNALEALVAVRESYEFFELNVGQLARGRKKIPFPEGFILDEMKNRACKLLITTDCHKKEFLSYGFDVGVELLRAHGFTEIYHLTDSGFVGRKI